MSILSYLSIYLSIYLSRRSHLGTYGIPEQNCVTFSNKDVGSGGIQVKNRRVCLNTKGEGLQTVIEIERSLSIYLSIYLSLSLSISLCIFIRQSSSLFSL